MYTNKYTNEHPASSGSVLTCLRASERVQASIIHFYYNKILWLIFFINFHDPDTSWNGGSDSIFFGLLLYESTVSFLRFTNELLWDFLWKPHECTIVLPTVCPSFAVALFSRFPPAQKIAFPLQIRWGIKLSFEREIVTGRDQLQLRPRGKGDKHLA